jgi:O-antigen ligase like membrane protein
LVTIDKIMLRLKILDSIIISLMFLLLPIDMVNGIFKMNEIPIPVSQIFKIFLIVLILFRLVFETKALKTLVILFFLLLLPTLYQIFSNNISVNFVLYDLTKITKYLSALGFFLFFVNYIKKRNSIKLEKLFSLVGFSYIILAINVLLIYVGLGYPSYSSNIGSKGYFFAGNELSGLLIVLYSIIAYRYWLRRTKTKFYIFTIFSFFIGLTISSKTSLLGVLIIAVLIIYSESTIKINVKFIKHSLIFFVIAPIVTYYSYIIIINSGIISRWSFFWEKLDFWSFLLSNRNNAAEIAFEAYYKNYSILEKFIGVGQYNYEFWNNGIPVEIDVLDIFFAYGIVGSLLFLGILGFAFTQSRIFSRKKSYPFASHVSKMILLLFLISSLAGHIFSSGLSSSFIGLLFSLMYIKRNDEITA